MKKMTALRLLGSLLASNLGIAFTSYAGFRMGWWTDQTMWKVLFFDGLWFCAGSFVNMIMLANP